MYYAEFFYILQRHFEKTISDEELNGILFDFVIIPANITVNGEYLSLDKAKISKILNKKAPMHRKIRDHIYDASVINDLVSNFDKNIVSELNPEKEDLCFQLMNIINKDNISPSHKSEFAMLAQPETIAAFLAKGFIYAVTTNGENGKIETDSPISSVEKKPRIKIIGIDPKERRTGKIILNEINEYMRIEPKSILNELQEQINNIACIPIVSKTQDNKNCFGIYEPCKYPTEKEKIIKEIAKIFEIDLPKNFFEFPNLYVNRIAAGINGYGTINGHIDEKKKYRLMEDLYKKIIKADKAISFYETFKNYYCLAMAIQNDGIDYDEDIRITLSIPRDLFLTPEEIATFQQNALLYLVEDSENGFSIKRGIDFLSYDESTKTKSLPAFNTRDYPFGKNQPVSLDEIKDLFDFYYDKDDKYYYIEIVFDELNQHTTIAFPTIITLKTQIKMITYTIKSKKLEHIVTGVIQLST